MGIVSSTNDVNEKKHDDENDKNHDNENDNENDKKLFLLTSVYGCKALISLQVHPILSNSHKEHGTIWNQSTMAPWHSSRKSWKRGYAWLWWAASSGCSSSEDQPA